MAYITTIVHETFINIFYTNGLYHDYCRSLTFFIQMAYITTIVHETFINIFYTNGLYHDYCPRPLSTTIVVH